VRTYVAVLQRRDPGRRPVDLGTFVDAAAARCLPFEPVGQDRWSSPDGRTLVAAWTNEPEQPDRPLLLADHDGARGSSGYVNGEVPPLDRLLSAGEDIAVGGVWSFVAAGAGRVAAATCASGAEVVFYAVSDDRVVVGNRALLVHLVAHPEGPVPDLVGLAGVVSSGYCVTDRTAYDGVRCLPPASRITCGPDGRVEVTAYGDPRPEATAADVAQALIDSVSPLTTLEQPVRLGLTGGRDSRLLVALLTRAGVPVATHTSGLPEDPDVIVAQEVAAALGVPHKVGSPMGAAVEEESVTFDVRSRVREAVVLGDAMLSAYDRVGRVGARYNATTVPFAGSGGEILRAYYAGSVKDPDDLGALVKFMRSRMYQSAKRMVPATRKAYEADTAGWVTAAQTDGVAALEDFYVRQRTGRWTGAARSSASIGSLARRPYLDHLVVRAVRGVPLADRTSERLIADVLAQLAPGLADVRFAGRRWKFDEQPPTDPERLAAWHRRAPVRGAHGDEAAFSWRTDLPEVRQELADIVLGAPAPFWQLVDRRKVTEFVAATEDRTRADTMRMWHLATVADALTHDFYVGPARFAQTRSDVVSARPAREPGAPPAGRPRRKVRSLLGAVRAGLRA
jgi:hypothetical protein